MRFPYIQFTTESKMAWFVPPHNSQSKRASQKSNNSFFNTENWKKELKSILYDELSDSQSCTHSQGPKVHPDGLPVCAECCLPCSVDERQPYLLNSLED